MAKSVFKRRATVFAAAMTLMAPLQAHHPASPAGRTASLPASARVAAAAVDAFHAALRNGNTAAAAALLVGDALIFESGEAQRSKAEYAAHHLGADAAYTQAVPERVTRRAGQAVGNIAWIATEGRTTGIYHGKAIDRVTTETMVLKRAGGAWKIVHIHWSSGASS